MLKKPYRLSRQKDFGRLKHSGRSFFCPAFRLRCLANNLVRSRFAVVVSTKISKKAVVRNRLRRQILEIIRLNLDKIKPGNDFIIAVNQKALGLTSAQLEHEFLSALKKNFFLVN